MVPCLKRLSVTVGTSADEPVRVPWVRSTGPILNVHINIMTLINKTNVTNPRIPSTPLKPLDVEASPIDWDVMTRAGDKVTVSRSGSQKV
jgi:hypothetical protein